MKQWRLNGSTAGCATGLPAFDDGPALCRKPLRWSTPPSHCLPPTTLMEQRQNSPCHCFLNTLKYSDQSLYAESISWKFLNNASTINIDNSFGRDPCHKCKIEHVEVGLHFYGF